LIRPGEKKTRSGLVSKASVNSCFKSLVFMKNPSVNNFTKILLV
jgi:hypothetical protein